MKQYLEIIDEILTHGTWKNPSREGLPRSISRFGITKRFNLQEGFPLVTTRKIPVKAMIHELIWFLRGDTNIHYLANNNVHVWDEDFYKHYLNNPELEGIEPKTLAEWKEAVKDPKFASIYGSGGPLYGQQWRNWNGNLNYPHSKGRGIDQIANLIKRIIETPDDRYKLVTAWNPTDIPHAALPSCHVMFMMNVRTINNIKYLDCSVYQRSCDVPLGVPFNIASYALLTHIIAAMTGCHVGDLIWNGQDCHLYENQIELAKEQLKREPKKLPTLGLNHNKLYNNSNITIFDELVINDIFIHDYKHHPIINYPLSTGLIKTEE